MVGQPILIGFGANINPLHNLYQGLQRLHHEFPIARVSTVWRTRPVAEAEGPDFLNGVVQLGTLEQDITPNHLREVLRRIEAKQNRIRQENRNAPRTLDLDIAMMGRCVFQDPWTIPDPEILIRPFLAQPLAELVPDLIHPLEMVSMRTLATRCKDLEGMRPDVEATHILRTIGSMTHENP